MKNLYPLLVAVFLALIIGYYFFAPTEIYILHDCKIQKTGSCHLEKEGVSLTLKMEPLPIIPTEDITYRLKTQGINVQEASIRLLGHDMEMPRDEQVFPLTTMKTSPGPIDSQERGATRTFPTCTEKLMTWRLYLIVKGEKKWVRTTFDLIVERK